MKRLARLAANKDAEIVSIWEIKKRIDQDPKKWSGREYYSLVDLKPMSACVRGKKKRHFKYRSGHSPEGHGNGGEGVVHELAILNIFERAKLTLREKEVVYHLQLRDITTEKLVQFDGDDYRVDLHAYFTSDPPELAADFNGEIAIEICVTNPVSPRKRAALRNQSFGTVEIKIDVDKLELPQPDDLTQQVLRELRNRLRGLFQTARYFSCIHSPRRSRHLRQGAVPENVVRQVEVTPTPLLPSIDTMPKLPCPIDPLPIVLSPEVNGSAPREKFEPRNFPARTGKAIPRRRGIWRVLAWVGRMVGLSHRLRP